MANYYPPVGFHFKVEFGLPGLQATNNDFRFREVAGISMELQEETITEGGQNRYIQKLPLRTHYPDLVLKRGLLTSSVVMQWCKNAIEQLIIIPITVWVHILNENHQPLQTYCFINAWPKSWSISDLNAEQNEVVVETLELTYQYFNIY